jgi:hypothetical protein
MDAPDSTDGHKWESDSALGGIRTPNLLIRSQMLYPLSYERGPLSGTGAGYPTAWAFPKPRALSTQAPHR